MRAELTGFAPDLDPATPGVLTDCNAIIPTTAGLSAANSPVTAGLPALAATPTSAYVAELLDGSKRTLAATAAGIYEAVGSSWTDRSRVGGYTGTNRTRFCVFGNNVLSANRTQVIGQAAPGGAFADIAGAPTASILVAASGFVMALNINGMGIGDQADGWGCCALRNQTDWSPSVSTQCAAGRLLDSPGAIRAGAALGSDVVAYKSNSMYLGRYVGGSLVWAWQRIPGDIGCSGAESVVVVGTQHFFIGPSDIYVFDGTVPRPIGGATFNSSATPVREWFFANLNATYRANIVAVADTARDLVYFYFPSTASSNGALDSVLVYNYRLDRWGKWSMAVSTALQYSSGQVTFDGLGAMYATYDDLPNIAYDSSFWLSDQTVPGVFIGNTLYSLTGSPGGAWWQSGDIGDLTDYTMLRRATPRYRVDPTTATATNFYRESLGTPPTQDSTIGINRRRFDFRRASRWHRLRVDTTGAMTVTGLDLDIVGAGRE